MQMLDLIFYVFALLIIFSASVVVFAKNIIYSAFALLFTFFGVAAIYVLLTADFLAVTQLLIYVGGILVLMLFGVMLTHKLISVDIAVKPMRILPATIIIAMIAGTLIGIFTTTQWKSVESFNGNQIKTTTNLIGEAFLTAYLLPFEVASVVLLVALIGAALLARREKPKNNV